MKKLVSLVLALCMLLSVVAVASAEEKVVINVWRKTFNLAQPDQDQVKKVEAAINEYIADKINVQIVLTDMSGEYEDQAKLAMANNEIDLLWTASWESIIGTNDLVPANAVADITDYLPGTALYGSMSDGTTWIIHPRSVTGSGLKSNGCLDEVNAVGSLFME